MIWGRKGWDAKVFTVERYWETVPFIRQLAGSLIQFFSLKSRQMLSTITFLSVLHCILSLLLPLIRGFRSSDNDSGSGMLPVFRCRIGVFWRVRQPSDHTRIQCEANRHILDSKRSARFNSSENWMLTLCRARHAATLSAPVTTRLADGSASSWTFPAF